MPWNVLLPLLITLFILFIFFAFGPLFRRNLFDTYPVYEGEDLGLTYSPSQSVFKVWSPPTEAMDLRLYETGIGGEPFRIIAMQQSKEGIWSISLQGDLIDRFYAFRAKFEGEWMDEVPDPYAKAVGVNGYRAMVIDLHGTDPPGWELDKRPPLQNPTDAVIYELHIRDLSMHPNSGIRNKGKFLGLTESNTKNRQGESTGLDHLLELGVTHIHLLPVFDYKSIDESKLGENQFNWGYDPQNYNVPEGSYATDPYDGRGRISEFKQMVKTLHKHGLRVIMDVVYNHTFATESSNFNQLVPGYYYRQDRKGRFSDASGCGNETASERPMMRKFIVESVKYWAEEYHIDGFRFDLMGIHDIETMNEVSRTLHSIDPSILIYGEGWAAKESPLPASRRAIKVNTPQLQGIAAFSDDLRDGIRGHVFTPTEQGFVSGRSTSEESIKFGVVASTPHPQIDYEKVNYSKAPWAKFPAQTINYASCHDNHTLWDRLALNTPDASEAERIKMHKLAVTIVLTSQGIPLLHAGVEMLRTKSGEENSFQSPDEINRIDWERKAQHKEVFDYVQQILKLRKQHPAFRMTTTQMITRHLRFLDTDDDCLVAFTIEEHANGDPWKNILVAYNGNREAKTLSIPRTEWQVALDERGIDLEGIRRIHAPTLRVPGRSASVLFSI